MISSEQMLHVLPAIWLAVVNRYIGKTEPETVVQLSETKGVSGTDNLRVVCTPEGAELSF